MTLKVVLINIIKICSKASSVKIRHVLFLLVHERGHRPRGPRFIEFKANVIIDMRYLRVLIN